MSSSQQSRESLSQSNMSKSRGQGKVATSTEIPDQTNHLMIQIDDMQSMSSYSHSLDKYDENPKYAKSPRETYDPAKSLTSREALSDWLKAEITGKLSQIPGIGDKNTENFRNCKDGSITTTYELIGKFLLMKGEGVTQVEHCDRFHHWLKDFAGIHSHRNSIVQAVAMKANLLFPGIYDESIYKMT